MSDNIPFEIQAEIIKRLPVKSLVQVRSVSKQWKSLIDSREFIAAYDVCRTQPQHLIVWNKYPVLDTEEKYVSFVDDETFAIQEFAVTVPGLAKLLNGSRVVGSCHGLLCLYGYYRVPGHSRHNSVQQMTILWNPSIKKSVRIPVPGVLCVSLETILGFGVCPVTADPTIVKNPQVVLDRFIYWFAFDKIEAADGGFSTNNKIMSFDMTTEEFRVVDLLESLAHQFYLDMSISKVRESLAMLEYATNMQNQVCNVWVMDRAVPNLFTKLFTINAPYVSIKTLGFTKSGEPIMEAKDSHKETAALVVYERCSGHTNDIGIDGNYGSFFVGSYMETLLLLDQADCSVYSN